MEASAASVHVLPEWEAGHHILATVCPCLPRTEEYARTLVIHRRYSDAGRPAQGSWAIVPAIPTGAAA